MNLKIDILLFSNLLTEENGIKPENITKIDYKNDTPAYKIFSFFIFIITFCMSIITLMVLFYSSNSILRTIFRIPTQSEVPEMISSILILIVILFIYKYKINNKKRKINRYKNKLKINLINMENKLKEDLIDIESLFSREKKDIMERLSLKSNEQFKIKEFYYISQTEDFIDLEYLKNIHREISSQLGENILGRNANEYVENTNTLNEIESSNYLTKIDKIREYENVANQREEQIHEIVNKDYYMEVTSSTKKKLFLVKLILSILYFIAGFLTFVTGIAYNLKSTINFGVFLFISGFGIIPFLINYFANINNWKNKTHAFIFPIINFILSIFGWIIYIIIIISEFFRNDAKNQNSSSSSYNSSSSINRKTAPSFKKLNNYAMNDLTYKNNHIDGDQLVIKALKGEIDSGALYKVETSTGFQADRLYSLLLNLQKNVDHELSNASYGYDDSGKMKGVESTLEYQMNDEFGIQMGSEYIYVTKAELRKMQSIDGLIDVVKQHGILR